MPPSRGGDMFTPALDQTIRQNYTAMCENIDRLIGVYLDKLASRGELENTIIVFSSDHGEMLGDKGHTAKNLPYQASVSVPLTIAGPGIQEDAASDSLVSTLDLTATYLDYGGAGGLHEMDSKSLRPLLEGKTSEHRDVAFSALGAWRMAYDGRYKVICGFDPSIVNPAEWTIDVKEVRDAPPLVFDLKEDPWEDRNLAKSIPAPAQHLLEQLS
jgi:arylsulfatase A-like enzyme